ncbi:MAG: biotin/lipoyl-binding protein [Spirochaetaceae bacterium]|nr:MAG: biotin/lipoyl-binding protein [Spirochaetaceae bacterium]
MKKIHFMNTAFRDGFQSFFGARVFTKDFLPAVEAAREAGILHFEAGGGARFQSLYFYCNEDAFEMTDAFRAAAGPDADLQTLARGINVVGLDSQPRDIIKLHAELFKKHGISTIRNFDALNDVDNLTFSGQCIVDAGLRHEVCVTMMELPPGVEGAHTAPYYVGVLKGILKAEIPFQSVCFKDASGTSVPRKVHETIKEARKLLGDDTHITFHTHETAGTSVASYIAAIEAGADQIDLSMAPVSGGTAQPDIITMWHALRGTEYDLDVDIKKVMHAEEVFSECMKEYFFPPEAIAVEPLIPFSPMPGGALTANTQMMRDNGILDRYPEVARAMGEAVARGGFGTSVTPVSQFYFQQAFNNVMVGPWKKIAEGYGKMVLGYFGKTPYEPDEEIVKIAEEQLGLPRTTESPLEINERDPSKGADAARKVLETESIEITDENIFIAAACKEKGISFLKGEARTNVRKKKPGESDKQSDAEPSSSSGSSSTVTVTVGSHTFDVEVHDGRAIVSGKEYPYSIGEARDTEPAPSTGNTITIDAPMPGLVLRLAVKAGDAVKKGDEIVILEAMKMETPVTAPEAGTVEKISISTGDQVTAGQTLMTIKG